MVLQVSSASLRLALGQILTLDDAAGREIVAREGCVWVTEEGDREDHVVCPGEARVVQRRGRTVVQAMSPAWVAIQ